MALNILSLNVLLIFNMFHPGCDHSIFSIIITLGYLLVDFLLLFLKRRCLRNMFVFFFSHKLHEKIHFFHIYTKIKKNSAFLFTIFF